MIITAILMGFAGSLHCVGMCSPLAMAVGNLNPKATFNRMVYNLGRILMYGILGAVAGTLALALPFSKFQNILSVALGTMLIALAVFGIKGFHTSLFQKPLILLKNVFGKFIRRKNYLSTFILGTLNGLLPCGLTFLALTYTLTLEGPLSGFYFMVLFGAGTLPVMLGLTSVIQYLVKRFNISFQNVTLSLFFVSGVLLIVRVFIFQHAHFTPQENQVVDIILCR